MFILALVFHSTVSFSNDCSKLPSPGTPSVIRTGLRDMPPDIHDILNRHYPNADNPMRAVLSEETIVLRCGEGNNFICINGFGNPSGINPCGFRATLDLSGNLVRLEPLDLRQSSFNPNFVTGALGAFATQPPPDPAILGLYRPVGPGRINLSPINQSQYGGERNQRAYPTIYGMFTDREYSELSALINDRDSLAHILHLRRNAAAADRLFIARRILELREEEYRRRVLDRAGGPSHRYSRSAESLAKEANEASQGTISASYMESARASGGFENTNDLSGASATSYLVTRIISQVRESFQCSNWRTDPLLARGEQITNTRLAEIRESSERTQDLIHGEKRKHGKKQRR